MADTITSPFLIKCVAVGDGAVGKTSMLACYCTNKFPAEYVPTIFDNYAVDINVAEQACTLGLFDTAGQEEYDRLRLLAYPETDVFLVCFSVTMRSSYNNVVEKWVPELRQIMPKTPLVLVGTKTDLRQGASFSLSQSQGETLAKRIRADCYVECSALTQNGLTEVFEAAILAAIDPKCPKKSGIRKACSCLCGRK